MECKACGRGHEERVEKGRVGALGGRMEDEAALGVGQAYDCARKGRRRREEGEGLGPEQRGWNPCSGRGCGCPFVGQSPRSSQVACARRHLTQQDRMLRVGKAYGRATPQHDSADCHHGCLGGVLGLQ